jgi:hypothetical protein
MSPEQALIPTTQSVTFDLTPQGHAGQEIKDVFTIELDVKFEMADGGMTVSIGTPEELLRKIIVGLREAADEMEAELT